MKSSKRAKRAKRKAIQNQRERDHRRRFQKLPDWKTGPDGERLPLTRKARLGLAPDPHACGEGTGEDE